MYQSNFFGIQVQEEISVSNEKIKRLYKTNYFFFFITYSKQFSITFNWMFYVKILQT